MSPYFKAAADMEEDGTGSHLGCAKFWNNSREEIRSEMEQ